MMKNHVIRITADNLAHLPHWYWRSSLVHCTVGYGILCSVLWFYVYCSVWSPWSSKRCKVVLFAIWNTSTQISTEVMIFFLLHVAYRYFCPPEGFHSEVGKGLYNHLTHTHQSLLWQIVLCVCAFAAFCSHL